MFQITLFFKLYVYIYIYISFLYSISFETFKIIWPYLKTSLLMVSLGRHPLTPHQLPISIQIFVIYIQSRSAAVLSNLLMKFSSLPETSLYKQRSLQCLLHNGNKCIHHTSIHKCLLLYTKILMVVINHAGGDRAHRVHRVLQRGSVLSLKRSRQSASIEAIFLCFSTLPYPHPTSVAYIYKCA